MTWPTKRQWQWQWQWHLEITLIVQPKRLVTFETFDQSDEKTWPDQKKDNYKDKYKDKYKKQRQWQRQIIDLWHLRHWLQYWKLRTWIHDNLCYLTINFDTGQHSQFLQCFESNAEMLEIRIPRTYIVCITCLIKHLRNMNRFHNFLLCAAYTSLFRHGCSNMKRQDNDPKKITVQIPNFDKKVTSAFVWA